MSFLVNPNSVFIIIWVSLIGLFSLRVLEINVEYTWGAIIVIFINIVLAVLMLVVSSLVSAKFDISDVRLKLSYKKKVINQYIKFLFLAYFFIAILDVVYSGGIPFYWRLTGDARQYVDFGVPTLHGIANSIIFFLSAAIVLLDFMKIVRARFMLVVIFVWQFFIFSRGTIMVMVVQMLSVYIFLSKPTLKGGGVFKWFGTLCYSFLRDFR